jgi:hypothetical protein
MTDPEDPPRLVDPASSASPKMRRLLEQSRADVGSAEELGRLEGMLAPVLWPGNAGPAAAKGAAAKSAAAKGVAGLAVKVAAGAIVVAGASALWLSTPRENRPADAPRATRGAAPSTLPVPATLPSAASPEPPRAEETGELPAAGTPPPSSNGARRPTADSLSEADLLGQAQAALSSDPARALALSERHRSHFAHPLLTQEREVIAVEALGRLGRAGEAKARGERFLRLFPASAYRSKIESILGVR